MNKTSPIGMLLYPDGSIYVGQMTQFVKQGVGKVIEYSGGFKEGRWENEKLSGPNCRIYNHESGDFYQGPVEEGKRNGRGRLYDADRDEVYDGEFENDKKQGVGMIYKRNGQVMKGDFRNNCMEGPFENVYKADAKELKDVFDKAINHKGVFIAVQK